MCLNVVTNKLDQEEENPRVPVDSETIVDLDKTEAVIPPRDNTVSSVYTYITCMHGVCTLKFVILYLIL